MTKRKIVSMKFELILTDSRKNSNFQTGVKHRDPISVWDIRRMIKENWDSSLRSLYHSLHESLFCMWQLTNTRLRSWFIMMQSKKEGERSSSDNLWHRNSLESNMWLLKCKWARESNAIDATTQLISRCFFKAHWQREDTDFSALWQINSTISTRRHYLFIITHECNAMTVQHYHYLNW